MIEIGIIKDTPVNKIIDIRDKNQVIKAKYAIGKDDILKYTLMAEHYIEISFELNRNASFKRSDYIEWEGDKYTLREDYQPEQINKRKYKYTLKFEAVEMFFQDIQYWYLGQGLKESELRMTGNPEYFLKYAVENANRYFKTTEFNMGTVEPTEIKDITFEVNTNTFNALTQIADEYGAEWYITGKTIHLLNKVSFGDEVNFETEVSVLSMKREEGESTTRYTRILALGSTRNIPYDYRETTPNEAVDAIYPKRLRIPASKGDVIDAYPNMSPDEVVEGTVIFDEVYPRREGTIEAVGTIEYQDVNEDTGEVTKWNAYKFKDSGINFKEEYMLPGQELKLQFISGDLNGRDFALKFHPKDFSSTDSSQFFEIYRTDEFGKLLPNDVMKPKDGDKYVLYGFNIALVSDQYVQAGELELYDVATTWQQKQLRDTGVYECPTVIGYFKDHQMDLAIGQKVRLIKDIGSNRNLLRNTNFATNASYWMKTGSYNMYPTPNAKPTSSSNNSLYVEANKIGNAANNLLTQASKRLEVGKTYTISFWAAIHMQAATLHFEVWGGIGSKNFSVPSGWTFITHTFTVTANNTDQSLYFWIDKVGAFYLNNIQLEEGNKSSTWNLAPEDVPGTIRSSRIMGFEKKLNNKFDAIYTVGDNSTYSRFGKIEQQIKELQVAGVVYENTGGSGVYVIKQFDTTRPTDFNVYSALASDAKYFNKQTGGTVMGDTIFQKNMQVMGTAISDVFQNSTFTAGQLGSGFQIKRDANGQSYMEIDNLLVRREAVFNRLTIAEIKSVGGTILLSLANMVVSKVEDKTSTFKCYFDSEDGTIPNDFAVGDQAICRKFTGKNIKYYWALVTAVGSDYIELSKTDKDGSGVPDIDDEVVQLGNRTDVNRQYAIMLSAYGSDAPSIKQYAGINSYDMTGKEVTAISPKGNKFTGSFSISTNGTTAPVYKDLGLFVNGRTYYLNDRVSHLGSYWVCIVNSTIQTPNESSTVWRKDTTGTTDINNAINNIQIGGTNLLRNTAFLNGTNHWVGEGSYRISVNDAKPTGSNNMTLYVNGSVSGGSFNHVFSIPTKRLVVGSAYTISFWAALDAGVANVHFEMWGGIGSTNFEVKEGWKFYTHTFTITTDNKEQPIYFWFDRAAICYFNSLKLEDGNKSTAWSAAPEDIQNQITNVEKNITQMVSSLVVMNDKIESKVSQTDFNSLQGRVSDTESSITQQAGLIASTVEKVDKKNSVYKSYTSASTDRPNVPYAKGDLWVTYDGTILQSNTNRLDGSFVQSDWVKTTKYIDESAIDDIQIGGVNLLRNTNFSINASYWGKTGSYNLYPTPNAKPTGSSNNSLYVEANQIGSAVNNILTQPTRKLEVGKTYILSFWAAIHMQAATLHFELWGGIGSKNFSVPSGWTFITHTFTVTANNADQSLYFWIDKVGSFYINNIKLEEGNKYTAWSLSPEDIQAGIDKAQDTADSKIRTFYSDTQPSTPSGGFKVGDLWYKISLSDGCYETYRWNGSTWTIININVSKSRIEQTDTRITSIVEKTGIDSLGGGETLYSKINQTANEISLEVSKTQIGGGVNLLRNTAFKESTRYWSYSGTYRMYSINTIKPVGSSNNTLYVETNALGSGINSILTQAIKRLEVGKTYTLSFWGAIHIMSGNFHFEMWGGIGSVNFSNPGNWQFYTHTFTVTANNADQSLFFWIDKITPFYMNNIQLVEGNKALGWQPSQEDTLNEIGSKLTLTDNKISLASTTIELKGTTIAKAIQAESLDVGNGNFHVGTDGIISAKGANIEGKISSNANGNRILIDPNSRNLMLLDSSNKICGFWQFYNNGSYLSVKDDRNEVNINGNSVSLQTNIGTGFILSVLGLWFNINILPTKSNLASLSKGQVYRDGDTLKIKITD